MLGLSVLHYKYLKENKNQGGSKVKLKNLESEQTVREKKELSKREDGIESHIYSLFISC